MHQNKDYNILLKKLISGTITDKERWTLERASLDDPFLADAIEGIYDNDVDTNTSLTLDPAPEIRRLSWYKPITIAASVIMLLGFSFLIIQNMENDKLEVVAEAEITEPLQEVTTAGDYFNADDDAGISENEILEVSIDKNPASVAVTSRQPNISSQSESKKSAKPKSKQKEEIRDEAALPIFERKAKPLDVVEANESRLGSMEDAISEEEIVAIQASKSKMVIDGIPLLKPQLVKGHVYDQEGFPINKAVVYTQTESDSAITNEAGYFSMIVSDMDQQLNVQSSGFSPQSTLVKPELSFNLRKAQSSFGQEPMLLVETMNANELKLEYSRLIDEAFREPFSICPQEQNISKRIKIRIEISESGQLLNVDYITNLSENCQLIIEDKIRKMSLRNQFKGKEAVSFYYNLRL